MPHPNEILTALEDESAEIAQRLRWDVVAREGTNDPFERARYLESLESEMMRTGAADPVPPILSPDERRRLVARQVALVLARARVVREAKGAV